MLYQNERGFYYKVGTYIVYQSFCIKSQEDAIKSVKELSGNSGYVWNGKYTDSQAPNGFYY